MEDIFKSYDIRGIYPTDINEDIIYRIGRATVGYLGAKVIAVGTDNRSSSPSLVAALERGIIDSGAEVISLGLISTPMLYFASARLDADGAIMVTASHNPKEYNGLKICRKNAVPVGLASGLADIRNIALTKDLPPIKKSGTISARDITEDYASFIASFADFNKKYFHVATDTAHAMGVLELPTLEKLPHIVLCVKLYDTLETPGTCPHEANPLRTETLIELQHAVKSSGADLGIAFDGDADRIGFIDELGRIVPMDLVTALLAQALLPKYPNATVLYDLRSSRAVKKTIEREGGIAHECKVGHANIKKQMIEGGALLAGELSGHYYFSLGGYTAEMGMLPAILLMNLMVRTGKKLSRLVDELHMYAHSGEINLKVANSQNLIKRAKEKYADGTLSELDGIKVDYPDWWFSLRTSNTEPLLRLNLEATTLDLMEKKKAELLALLDT